MKKKTGAGLAACVEAFERLLLASPIVTEHVGLPSTKITSGVVSVEAGFDRGYLKAARSSHQALIARINAHRASGGNSSSSPDLSNQKHLSAAKAQIEKLEIDLEVALDQRDAVIAQNCQLHERLRILEQTLKKLQPDLSYLTRSPLGGD